VLELIGESRTNAIGTALTAFDELHLPIVRRLIDGDNFSGGAAARVEYAPAVRRFTLSQNIAADVDEHWRLFLDDDVERRMYVERLHFHRYELLERRETDAELVRKIRVVPKLDVPGAVAKLLGDSFAYTESQTFDKKTSVFRSKIVPSVFADQLGSETVVRAEAAGPGKCRRTVDLSVEARVFGIGGLVESALEKNLRSGWVDSAAYLDAEAAKKR
jgi:hypothetical protein